MKCRGARETVMPSPVGQTQLVKKTERHSGGCFTAFSLSNQDIFDSLLERGELLSFSPGGCPSGGRGVFNSMSAY